MKTLVPCLLLLVLTGPASVLAQEEEQQQQEQDNTGTNPINFTYDARFYMETSWLRDGGSLIAPTFEFRMPLGADLANLTNQKQGIFNDLGQRFALRLKFRPQHLKEQQNILSETMDYGMPRIYNLLKDPGETQNVLFPETWVPKAALGQLGAHVMSLRTEPPIKPGQADPYVPTQ